MSVTTQDTSELSTRTAWYINLRWVLLLLVIIPSITTSFFDIGWSDRFIRDLIFCGLALLSNSIFHALAHVFKNHPSMKTLAYVVVLTDVFLITLFLHSKGGIESRSTILYLLPMIAGAAILGRKGTYVITVASIFGFTFIILGAYLGILGPPLSMYTPQLDRDPGYVANTIVFFDFVLLIVAIALDYMTRLLISNEAKAQEAVTRMSQAQLIAKTGGWEYDARTKQIIYSEELHSTMKDIIDEPIIDESKFFELIHHEDRLTVQKKIASALRRPITFSSDHRMIARNGSIRYVHLDGQSVFTNKGEILQIIGFARDITDEKALEKARTDFMALASHQLRTPATIVKQYIGMLKEGFIGSLSQEQHQALDIVYGANERQIKIVNDLMNVARIDSKSYKISRRRTNLVEFLSDIIDGQKVKFQTKNQTLIFKTNIKELYARIDAHGIHMVINNILDNAHKYTSDKKSVKITLDKSVRTAIITISDNGTGIAKNDLPKIFELFSRVDNPVILEHEGTGLGLYWADSIVRLHKGKISVTSELNRGTTFKITLPL